MKKRKIFLYSITTTVFTIFFILIILEFLFRGFVSITRGPEKYRSEVRTDKNFGWVNNTQVKETKLTNKCGEEVLRTPLTHRLINKFPEYAGNKTILFIGDSYTQAWGVSSGKAFYDVFEENMKEKYSVFVAGIGGYGNLQEYMLLDSLYDTLKPDIVVWQLCSNDPSNNVFKLDNSSIFNNQRKRPYINPETGGVEIKNPGFLLFDWSRGFRFVFFKLLVIDAKYNTSIIDFFDSFYELDEVETRECVKQGLAVLDTLLAKAVTNFPETKFVGFSTDSIYDKKYEEIFRKHGAIYFDEFYNCVDTVTGSNCAPLDAHWNHLGHKIVGNHLSELFKKLEE